MSNIILQFANRVGIDGATPVKGVDYFTADDIASLNIPSAPSDIGAATVEQGTKADNAVQVVSQTLSTAQKTQARANIGAGTSSFSGNYSDLSGKPTLANVATSGAYSDLSGKPTDANGYTAKSLAIKDQHGTSADKKIWTGSQAEYDAITTPDSNTLYFIV